MELSFLGEAGSWRDAVPAVSNGAMLGCGRSFFYLGALLALGEPEVTRSAHFRVSGDGSIEFEWTRAPAAAHSTQSLDRPLLAYYVGAEKRDALSRLALSHYILKSMTIGIATKWWQSSGHDGVPSIDRIASNEDNSSNALCPLALRALQGVAEAAAENEREGLDASALEFCIRNATETHRAKKELHDWMAARSRDGHQPAKHSLALLLLHGDEDLGVSQNVSQAARLLDGLALDGNADSSWAALLLHAQEGNVSGILQNALKVRDSDAPQIRKVMAQHYLYLHGKNKNATLAGVYLLSAANLGESNAQQLPRRCMYRRERSGASCFPSDM